MHTRKTRRMCTKTAAFGLSAAILSLSMLAVAAAHTPVADADSQATETRQAAGTSRISAAPAIRAELKYLPQVLEIDGVIEAVRKSAMAAQVAGLVTAVAVQAGDQVHAGQELLQIEGESAIQARQAALAAATQARAELELASAEYQRRKTLYAQQYISRAAYEQARARHAQARAQLEAQLAQAQAASAQSSHYTLLAPYSGLISSFEAHEGDMVMPGRPLASMFDPATMRIEARVPQSRLEQLAGRAQIIWPHAHTSLPVSLPLQVLPGRDPASLSGTVRINLPDTATGLAPGTPVRLLLELNGDQQGRIWIPERSILRRAGLSAVFVSAADGTDPRLRKIRTGRTSGSQTEVLTGLAAGEYFLDKPDTGLAGGGQP